MANNVRLYRIILLMLMSCEIVAQDNSQRNISVGDITPDVNIDNIINYRVPSAKISNFRSDLLIIDFWATWCGPCISAFPKLDSIQKKFSNQVVILPVTTEANQTVASFLGRLNRTKNMKIFSAANDKTLRKLFWHTSLPHYVWLDRNLKVIAITDGAQVNEHNIRLTLQGQLPIFKNKNDSKKRVLYKYDAPTFMPSMQTIAEDRYETEILPPDKLVFQSVMTRYVEGLVFGFHSSADKLHLTVRNGSVLSLYRWAMLGNNMKVMNRSASLMKVEIPDSALYLKFTSQRGNSGLVGAELDEWARDNTYCYDLKVPPALANERFNIMLDNLNYYFGRIYGIEGVLEERNTDYLALVRIDSTDKLLTKGGKPVNNKSNFRIIIQNQKIGVLLNSLRVPLQLEPTIIDESGYTNNIDVELNCDLSNLKEVNDALALYGLRLLPRQKVMTVAVVRMKQKS